MEWKWNRNGMKMDWCKVFMWVGSICAFAALLFERFLPPLVVVALAVVGTAILVAIVAYLMDDKE